MRHWIDRAILPLAQGQPLHAIFKPAAIGQRITTQRAHPVNISDRHNVDLVKGRIRAERGWGGEQALEVRLGHADRGPALSASGQSHQANSPDSPVYNCPSWPDSVPRINYFLAARWSASRNQHAMKLTDIRTTSRFVLSGDMTNATLYPGPFGQSEHLPDDCDKDDAVLPSLCFPYQAGGFWMHGGGGGGGGNNVLFDDGHVQVYRDFDPSAMTYDATAMRPWDQVVPP